MTFFLASTRQAAGECWLPVLALQQPGLQEPTQGHTISQGEQLPVGFLEIFPQGFPVSFCPRRDCILVKLSGFMLEMSSWGPGFAEEGRYEGKGPTVKGSTVASWETFHRNRRESS